MIDRWSTLELRMFEALTILMDGNAPAAFAVLYNAGSLGGKISIVRSVAQNVLPTGEERDGFISILDRVRKLSSTRNLFVHGLYKNSGNQISIALPRGSEALETQKFENVTANSIWNHCNAVEAVTNRLLLACTPDPARYMKMLNSDSYR